MFLWFSLESFTSVYTLKHELTSSHYLNINAAAMLIPACGTQSKVSARKTLTWYVPAATAQGPHVTVTVSVCDPTREKGSQDSVGNSTDWKRLHCCSIQTAGTGYPHRAFAVP